MTITLMSCISFGMMFMAWLTIFQTKDNRIPKVPRLFWLLDSENEKTYSLLAATFWSMTSPGSSLFPPSCCWKLLSDEVTLKISPPFSARKTMTINPNMSLVCPKITEKHEFKDTYPPQKGKKPLKLGQLHQNCSFAFRTVLNLKSCLKTFQAYFIKWTVSGDPPVALKSLQDSK